jgi:hypothetical protein
MTNCGALAILAELPEATPPRQVRLMIALETFPADADGWRTVSSGLLSQAASLSRNPFRRARRELVAAKLIEHEPGTKRGKYSRWRITFPLALPAALKGATQGHPLKKGAKGGHTRPQKGATPGPKRGPPPQGASGDDSGTLTSQSAATKPKSGMPTALET